MICINYALFAKIRGNDYQKSNSHNRPHYDIVFNRHLNINRNPFYTDIKNHAIDQ